MVQAVDGRPLMCNMLLHVGTRASLNVDYILLHAAKYSPCTLCYVYVGPGRSGYAPLLGIDFM